jgi:hypothetical protein
VALATLETHGRPVPVAALMDELLTRAGAAARLREKYASHTEPEVVVRLKKHPRVAFGKGNDEIYYFTYQREHAD